MPAARAIEGVEMPGAKVHNAILGQFHVSLSQDEVWLPAPSARGGRALRPRCVVAWCSLARGGRLPPCAAAPSACAVALPAAPAMHVHA